MGVAREAIDRLIGADELLHFDMKARLLQNLSHNGLLRRFPLFDPSSRKHPDRDIAPQD